MEEKPKRIECYDISHMAGTETVGSMSVFVNGKPKNEHYRSFTIRTMQKGEVDDYKALKEVLVRRMRHITEKGNTKIKKEEIALEQNDKFYVVIEDEHEYAYAERGFQYVRKTPKGLKKKVKKGKIVMMFDAKKNKPDKSLQSTPDLIVLDGGKGQLSTGIKVLKSSNLKIPIIGLAKREEEVLVPENPDPIPFSTDSEALFLLMRMRDEAHRFANNHREKRNKNAIFQ